MPAPDFDIIILGGGLAGAALARALSTGSGDSTLRIALIDARPLNTSGPHCDDVSGPADFDNRVSAITPASQRFIESTGAWSTIADTRLCPYSDMQVWDAEGTGKIAFTADEVDVPRLGHIIENRVINAGLLQGLDRRPGLTLISPVRLEAIEEAPDHVSLELEDGDRLSARLLVAADGALSRVRSLAGFRTREWDYGHKALVTTVETRESHQHTAYQRFLQTGPLAFLPLPELAGRSYSSIVWSAETDTADELVAMEDAAFMTTLGDAIEHRLGDILSCSPRVAFPLRQRHAVDYVKSRIALVGDAAHTIHPLAGQGINLGFADVASLSSVLASACRRGEDPGTLAVLRRYQRQRKGENLAMMVAMDGFKRLFGGHALPLRWARNRGMDWVGHSGPIKHQIMRHAMGLR